LDFWAYSVDALLAVGRDLPNGKVGMKDICCMNTYAEVLVA
jgi:hypothetical protein